MAMSQLSWAAESRSGGTSSSSISAAASWCWCSTRSMCSRFSAKPANGPMREAVRADTS